MSEARIAVLMASYNAENTIRPAVESVLASVVPVDVYIIDDGSRTPLEGILAGMPANVFIHRLEKNGGLARALNEGLKIILQKDYEFIARFDADDYCFPERFRVQMDYMAQHPDVQVVGCWANAVGADLMQPLFVIRHPEHHDEIVKAMYYNAAFLHPSLFFRADMLRGLKQYYNEDYHIAQDYELMARLIRICRTANVPQALINYSYLSEVSSKKKRRRQLWSRLKVQMTHFNPLVPDAWMGILKTLVMFVIPMELITKIKESRWKPAAKLSA